MLMQKNPNTNFTMCKNGMTCKSVIQFFYIVGTTCQVLYSKKEMRESA